MEGDGVSPIGGLKKVFAIQANNMDTGSEANKSKPKCINT